MEVVTKFALILPEKMRHANSFCFSVYGFGLSQTKTLSETDMPRSYFILSFFSFSLLTIYESTKNLPRRVSHTCFCAQILNCPKPPRKNPVFFIADIAYRKLTAFIHYGKLPPQFNSPKTATLIQRGGGTRPCEASAT